MSNQLPVLIVGAGPTGLMAACELARHDIPFRIIDKNSQHTQSSNATWIQTRTLELLDYMGVAKKFIQQGNRCNTISLYTDGELLQQIPLNVNDSTYEYVLMLRQAETENLLIEWLNSFHQHVERSLECIDVQQESDGIVSTIRHVNGRTETLKSQWLIACDGANSHIRNKCGLLFSGGDLTEQFIVADAKIESHMAKNEIHLFLDPQTLFAAFPMGEDNYRITANLHLDYQRTLYTEREVIELAQERAHDAWEINSVSWISPFWIHSKIVEQMRHGSIFLAGDAAHIHSPLSGQGMNAGLQDAINLAWKLALVIKKKASSKLLDSYQSERHPVVKKIVDESEHYTTMALLDKDFVDKFIKKISDGSAATLIARSLTQLDICYENSACIDYQDKTTPSAPRQGERAPNVRVNKKTTLYDQLRNTAHNILFFTGASISSNDLAKIIEIQHSLETSYPGLVKTYIVAREGLKEFNNLIHDTDGAIHERYHVKTASVYIIRPDNYICFYGKDLQSERIDSFLKKYFS
jgi:2-polyprenyl-6-methoxyphenol hydroxylase-like FAD-dependent oxidoreductase